MPYLIDGNNLIYALADATGEAVGRQGLCRLLRLLADRGERVHVVFDGGPPPAGQRAVLTAGGVSVAYSGRREADALILAAIAADSAPRRLHVISSDNEIRRPARARKCRSIDSPQFARTLLRLQRALSDPDRHRPLEPREKREGLSEQQTRRWLREFGLDS